MKINKIKNINTTEIEIDGEKKKIILTKIKDTYNITKDEVDSLIVNYFESKTNIVIPGNKINYDLHYLDDGECEGIDGVTIILENEEMKEE